MSLDNRTWFQKGLKDGIQLHLAISPCLLHLGSLQKRRAYRITGNARQLYFKCFCRRIRRLYTDRRRGRIS